MANIPWKEPEGNEQEITAFTNTMSKKVLESIKDVWGKPLGNSLNFLNKAQEEPSKANIWNYARMPIIAQKVPLIENNTLPTQESTVNMVPQVTTKKAPLDFSGELSLKDGKYVFSNPITQRILQVESNGNPNAVSNTGALGLMQLTKGAVNDYVKATGDVGDARDPHYNARVGSWYLQHQYNQLKGLGMDPTVADVYRAYNMGFGGYREVLDHLNKGTTLSPTRVKLMINNTPTKYRTGNPAKDWMNFTNDKFKDFN